MNIDLIPFFFFPIKCLVLIGFWYCFKDFIYLFMRDTEREGESQVEGEAGSLWEARCGT